MRRPERSEPCPRTGASNAMKTPATAIATPSISDGPSSPSPVPKSDPDAM